MKGYFVKSEYRLEKELILSVSGCTDKGDALTLDIYGFNLFFAVYLRSPGVCIDDIKEYIDEKLGFIVTDIEEIEAKEFIDVLERDTDTYYLMYVSDPKKLKEVEELYNYDSFLQETMFLYETDANILSKLIIEINFKFNTWYDLSGLNLQQQEEEICSTNFSIWKNFNRVNDFNVFREWAPRSFFRGRINYQNVVKREMPGEDGVPPPLFCIALDGEMDNENGLVFPNPEFNEILQFAFVENIHGQDEQTVILFALYETPPTDNIDILYSFENEKDLVRAMYWYLKYRNPDVIMHHNGNGFDVPYLVKRAKELGLKEDFENIGRLRGRKLHSYSVTNKGFTKHNLSIPGILSLDTMRVEQERPGSRETGLDDVAKKYLGEQKYEMPMNTMTTQFKTMYGRQKIARYCAMDAVLVLRLVKFCHLLVELFETVGILHIDPQTYLNSSLEQKLNSFFMYYGRWEESPRCLKITEQSRRERFEEWSDTQELSKYSGTKGYKGAEVLKPQPGVYETPVVLVDFASLYPSIMMGHNLCFSTTISNHIIKCRGYVENKDFKRIGTLSIVDDQIKNETTEKSPAFVLPHRREGIIVRIEKELKARRSSIKKLMAEQTKLKESTGKKEHALRAKLYDIQQNAVKVIMNSMYGILGSKFGKFRSTLVADTITSFGRLYINCGKYVAEKTIPGAQVVYGDTGRLLLFSSAFPSFSFEVRSKLGHTRFFFTHSLWFDGSAEPIFFSLLTYLVSSGNHRRPLSGKIFSSLTRFLVVTGWDGPNHGRLSFSSLTRFLVVTGWDGCNYGWHPPSLG